MWCPDPCQVADPGRFLSPRGGALLVVLTPNPPPHPHRRGQAALGLPLLAHAGDTGGQDPAPTRPCQRPSSGGVRVRAGAQQGPRARPRPVCLRKEALSWPLPAEEQRCKDEDLTVTSSDGTVVCVQVRAVSGFPHPEGLPGTRSTSAREARTGRRGQEDRQTRPRSWHCARRDGGVRGQTRSPVTREAVRVPQVTASPPGVCCPRG